MLAHDIGVPPIIIEAKDLLREPRNMLIEICKKLSIVFDEKMLSWPTGVRKTDGIWGKHWYKKVETSTGFKPYIKNNRIIPPEYQGIYDECMKYYNFLYQKRVILN
jgi:hypothetical protein